MAAAYAVPAANGVYCKPIVLTKIVDDDGKSLPVPSAGCHRAIPVRAAQAVNYILQGVLDFPDGTAYGNGLANYQAAGKTGTSNVESGNGTPYAAFAGYTTALVGYVSVFNPASPTKTRWPTRAPATARSTGTRTASARCSARTPRCRCGT